MKIKTVKFKLVYPLFGLLFSHYSLADTPSTWAQGASEAIMAYIALNKGKNDICFPDSMTARQLKPLAKEEFIKEVKIHVHRTWF